MADTKPTQSETYRHDGSIPRSNLSIPMPAGAKQPAQAATAEKPPSTDNKPATK